MLVYVLIVFLLCILIQVRNYWVFHSRRQIITVKDGVYVWEQYHSFWGMFFRFWIWDIEKLRLPVRTTRPAGVDEGQEEEG